MFPVGSVKLKFDVLAIIKWIVTKKHAIMVLSRAFVMCCCVAGW